MINGDFAFKITFLAIVISKIFHEIHEEKIKIFMKHEQDFSKKKSKS